ncbi:MAG: carbohydrate ABC transporter permease [Armatimonadetes bacterium]|nr:carbohydrate ABC transporter permease [Armatimonadota bacterium]MBI2972728.1 carbohydrate ABC transporter permease [Armatimonadota bacterium]
MPVALRSRSSRKIIGRIALYLAVAWFTFYAAFPFVWMLITAFKRNSDLYNVKNNPFLFNQPPTLEHMRLLFEGTPFLRWLWNTGFVGLMVVIITLVAAVPAGYSLARLARAWGRRLGIAIFLTYLVPPTLLFIPLSRVVAELRLQDNLWALVLVYPTFTIPFCTWLMMGFFKSIPGELEEAAMVDGCTRLAALRHIVLPISVAGILTVTIFAFALSMQEFTYALTFISPSSQKTVSIGVPTDLIRGDVFYWGSLMGGALVSAVPAAILYSLFLDRFIAGLTAGALK